MSSIRLLTQYAAKPHRYVIGLMSGTSVDGVDAALVRVSGAGRDTRAELLEFCMYPYPSDLRKLVLDLSHGEGNPALVSTVGVRVGQLFAEAALAVMMKADWLTPVDAVASHGQTISHTPNAGATLQIGEASVIAQKLGVPVVSDFRTADMAVGGQGAPLVPYVDWCLLTDPGKARAVQNIGGIGNVTYLPMGAGPEAVLGFDTGPGNMLIDAAVAYGTNGAETFDKDGMYAQQGTVNGDFLEYLLRDPFLHQAPPKSAGREQYGAEFFAHLVDSQRAEKTWINPRKPYDTVATLTAFTALSIVDAYERFLPDMPDEVIIGGGGARNPTLMAMLAEKLRPIPVRTHEDVGINSDAKEAIAFAVLANETLLGNPSNLPSVTGASRPVTLGKITLP